MKICGLITEYNPFHNGHIHHMAEARRLTGADRLIVVMSGSFVQRGAPSIIHQYERAKMALDGGADLVLQLPVAFSTASAEIFATAAINLLHQLGCVDAVCFGTESGELGDLSEIAKVLNNEPKSFQNALRGYVKTGVNYPTARSMALEDYFRDSIEDLNGLIEKPNNILGIEYLRALYRLRSSIQPYATKRWKTDYKSEQLYSDVASATAIRKMIYQGDGVEQIEPFVTPYTYQVFKEQFHKTTPIRISDFSMLLQYRLESECDHLSDYFDFAPELGERVKNYLPKIFSFKEWVDVLNTKTYTYSRIQRALIHLLLDIREDDMKTYAEEDYCLYARMLGFRRDAADLLTKIKGNTALPLISKMADAEKQLSPTGMQLLKNDVQASNIYRNAVYHKYGTMLKDDYTMGIIKL